MSSSGQCQNCDKKRTWLELSLLVNALIWFGSPMVYIRSRGEEIP